MSTPESPRNGSGTREAAATSRAGGTSGGAPAAPKAGRAREFLRRHGRKLWWLHSFYALGLGIVVMVIAGRGFQHARWLAVSLGAIWFLFLAFFRVMGSGATRRVEGTAKKVGFLAMTYVLKNLYQSMLFFLLPFYWKSATWGSDNIWFVVALAACTLLATLDVVFDHVLMRWRGVASVYYLFAQFACLNLVIPALLPSIRVLWTLLAAAAVATIIFLTLHVRLRTLFSTWGAALTLVLLTVAVTGAYLGRRAIPPVPYHVVESSVVAVGGRARQATDAAPSVSAAELPGMAVLTDVASPGGPGEPLTHVWRRDGREVARVRATVEPTDGAAGIVRMRSRLPEERVPVDSGRAGGWTVDVETHGGQLVGRLAFTVAAVAESAAGGGGSAAAGGE